MTPEIVRYINSGYKSFVEGKNYWFGKTSPNKRNEIMLGSSHPQPSNSGLKSKVKAKLSHYRSGRACRAPVVEPSGSQNF